MDIASGTPFDPSVAPNTGVITWSGGEGTQLLVINESYQNLFIRFADGSQSYVPANDRRKYLLSGQMAQPQNSAIWTVQSNLKAGNTVNQVVVEVYAPGEEMPEQYPAPLIRQANVAGQIVATGILLNTGNPLAQEIIKAVDTAVSPNVTYIDFIGAQLTLGNYVANAPQSGQVVLLRPGTNFSYGTKLTPSFLHIQTDHAQSDAFQIELTDATTNIYFFVDNETGKSELALGNSSDPGFIRIFGVVPGGGSFLELNPTGITTNAGNPTFNAPTALNFLDLQNNGVSVLQIQNTGAHIQSGSKLIWDAAAGIVSNGISRISYFTASITTTSSLFNHGLGVIPDMVIGINRGTGSTANPMKYNPATSTSTQAALVAAANGTFDCLAIKF